MYQLGKPVLLGEYGYRNSQSQTYKEWTDAVLSSGTNGDLFWMISGRSDSPSDNGWVRNYDGCVCNASAHADRMGAAL